MANLIPSVGTIACNYADHKAIKGCVEFIGAADRILPRASPVSVCPYDTSFNIQLYHLCGRDTLMDMGILGELIDFVTVRSP